tara:strand:+ start:782 stop:1075 length:294 start_codon:yes stop_codon:yes gene_type:complete
MTKQEESMKKFRDVVKLMVILQASLEQMDEIKNIPHLYRQDVKSSINNTERKIEAYLKPILETIPQDQETIFMQIQRGVDDIMKSTLEEIHNKKIEG